ncbi:MAG: YbaB/EbfC family nucleoid-associated protein [Saprospiraceae bacterium]|nr:YbaB/EbfC family nucleoid-associated protein [Saprospiraceae bacterium]
MFDKLFGKLQGQKDEMKERLAKETLEAEVEDGAIRVKVNGNREILDISIDQEKVDLSDTEQLEDFLIIAINQALELATELEASEAQKMINDMIPPGLGGLFGMKDA